MPFQQHLDDLTGCLGTTLFRAESHRKVIQAGNRTTVHAHEMRMFRKTAGRSRWKQFKPTDRISKVQPSQQSGIGKFRQAAIDRGLIKSEIFQCFGNLRMTLRHRRGNQPLDDRDPGCSTAQSGTTNQGLDIRQWKIGFRSIHDGFDVSGQEEGSRSSGL